jgi:hypothetical protein
MADEFPLPGSSYKELIKIIQAYGRIGTEASLGDVAQLAAMGETIISGNNRFLIAIGVVKAGKKKAITPAGAELATALEHQETLPDEVAAKWRVIVDATDFLQKVISAVRIRKGMDQSSLESHIAYSAGQPKTQAVATGSRTIVDILEASGLLKDDGGNLVPVTPEPRPITETVEKSLSMSDSAPTFPENAHAHLATSGRVGGVQLNIDVRVQCTPADLEGLGRKLRKVLKDFNEPEPKAEPSATMPAPGAAAPLTPAPPADSPNEVEGD